MSTMTVTEALERRISVRAFKSHTVPEALVREILTAASRAPSGGNLQPWKVIAVSGEERAAVTQLAGRALAAAGPDGEVGDKPVYPAPLFEPFRSRRYKLGEDMYALLGVGRDDKAGRLARFARNYEFFGAPVGLFFVIDERMGHGQWAHMGMFMQSIALAAVERGVSSCMQEAWAAVRVSLKVHFQLPKHDLVYCGMALGYADEAAPVNQLRADREPVDSFTSFRGF